MRSAGRCPPGGVSCRWQTWLVHSAAPAGADADGPVVSVASYDLVLDLTVGPDVFSSRAVVRLRCREGGAAWADLDAVSIGRVTLNGVDLDVADCYRDGRLQLPAVAGENTLVVDAQFGYVQAGGGLRRVTDPVDGSVCVYSKTSPAGASGIYCCFDRRDLRARYTVSIRAPAGWSCLTNAPARAHHTDRAAGTWRFAPTAPVAPYLSRLCAGPYSGPALRCESDRGHAVAVTIQALPSAADRLESLVDVEFLRRALRYYERVLRIPYPYEKCDIVFVPRLPSLAFSAPGLITIDDQVLTDGKTGPYLATVIAHELAHAWLGGLLDLPRPEDRWLVEALTTYLSRAALPEILPGTAPWSAATSRTLPDHGYASDAAAIKLLEPLIGPQPIIDGLRNLMRDHPDGNAVTTDLVEHWSRASGRDLRGWAAQTLTPRRHAAS
jgi:aminopeptidase N